MPTTLPRFRPAHGSSSVPTVAPPRGLLDVIAEGLARVGNMPVPPGVDPLRFRAAQLCTPEFLAEINAMTAAHHEPDVEAILPGDLSTVPATELLHRLAAMGATGTLTVALDSASAPLRGAARLTGGEACDPAICVFVRRGDVVMVTTTVFDADAYASALPPGLVVRARRDQAAGKPTLITMAEAGLVRASDLPTQLAACSAQLLGALLHARRGRYTWTAAAALPDFVDAFGAPIALEHDTRKVVVIDAGQDGFAAALRAHLGRRGQQVAVVELAPAENLADQVLALRPRAVLLNTRLFTPQLVEHELPRIRRDGTIKLAGVLDLPDPIESAFALASGVHVVVAKPIHVSDLDRLLLAGPA